MSKVYADLTNRVIELLDIEIGNQLSADLSKAVTAVKKGQYMPGGAAQKPVVYVRFMRPGLISQLAGNQQRKERCMFVISGAATGDTQEIAVDDCTNLMNNVEAILARQGTDALWGASYFGWAYGEDDANPQPFGEVTVEPASDRPTAYFEFYWSCDAKIQNY